MTKRGRGEWRKILGSISTVSTDVNTRDKKGMTTIPKLPAILAKARIQHPNPNVTRTERMGLLAYIT
ncbi:MAG: hypothetical protein NTX46_00015 [Chloroflexi bacterium]|nr:hypothetical protein [Chloroflexota bacterium]